MKEFLEITTKVGCPINCTRFCPQDVTVHEYTDRQKVLSLEDFEIVLKHVPEDLTICFSGFCEPFANKNALDMIVLAHRAAHPIRLNTTLVGLNDDQLYTLALLDFNMFCLHLPDGKNAHIQITQQYKHHVFQVLTMIGNVEFSIMNDLFESNTREEFCRSRDVKKHGLMFRYCDNWKNPKFVMMPNGDVYLCCMDFGLKHLMGNLILEPYEEIKKRYKPGYELCKSCPRALQVLEYAGSKLLEMYREGLKRRR